MVVAVWSQEQAETGQSHVVVPETLEVGHVVTMVAPDHLDEVLGGCQGVMDGQTGQFEQTNDKKSSLRVRGSGAPIQSVSQHGGRNKSPLRGS